MLEVVNKENNKSSASSKEVPSYLLQDTGCPEFLDYIQSEITPQSFQKTEQSLQPTSTNNSAEIIRQSFFLSSAPVIYQKYIGEQDIILRDMFTSGRKTILSSQTGSGKTYAIVNMAKAENKKVLILMPTTALSEQTANSSKIPCVIGSNKLHSEYYNQNAIIATYESLKRILDKAPDGYPGQTTLIIDEAHKLITTRDYRDLSLIASSFNKFKSIILLSGTAECLLTNLDGFSTVAFAKKEAIPLFKEIHLIKPPEKKKRDYVIDCLIKGRKKAGKQLVFIENIKELQIIKEYLVEKNYYKSSEIYIITGKTKEDRKHKEILETEFFPDGVKILLATSVIADGVNLKDTDINEITVVSYSDSTDVRQISARARKGYRRLNIIDSFIPKKGEKKEGIRLFNDIKKEVIKIAKNISFELKTKRLKTGNFSKEEEQGRVEEFKKLHGFKKETRLLDKITLEPCQESIQFESWKRFLKAINQDVGNYETLLNVVFKDVKIIVSDKSKELVITDTKEESAILREQKKEIKTICNEILLSNVENRDKALSAAAAYGKNDLSRMQYLDDRPQLSAPGKNFYELNSDILATPEFIEVAEHFDRFYSSACERGLEDRVINYNSEEINHDTLRHEARKMESGLVWDLLIKGNKSPGISKTEEITLNITKRLGESGKFEKVTRSSITSLVNHSVAKYRSIKAEKWEKEELSDFINNFFEFERVKKEQEQEHVVQTMKVNKALLALGKIASKAKGEITEDFIKKAETSFKRSKFYNGEINKNDLEAALKYFKEYEQREKHKEELKKGLKRVTKFRKKQSKIAKKEYIFRYVGMLGFYAENK